MATESSERYTSAGELAADVENWLEDRPLIGNPDDVPEMIARFYRLNPLLATGVTLFVLVDIPIFCQLLLGTHTAFEFVVISTFSSIAGGMGLGQVFSLPGALLGGLLGLIRGKGNWRDRTLSGAKTGFSQGLIIGCSTGVFLALTSTFFDYQYMPKNSEGVRTPPKELIVFMFVFACYVVSAIVGNIFLRLARQGERSWTFNLHLGMGWILAWTILFNFYLINEDFEGNLRASFLDLFPSDGHLLAIRDFATRLIQSTLVGMLVGYGLGGFVGLLSGIFQGRIFDRAITGSRIGMFVFAGIAVVLVIGDLIF